MATAEELAEIKAICQAAAYVSEGEHGFVDLPALKIEVGSETVTRHALLSLKGHSGYTSRLYLSEPIPGRGRNWTKHSVLGRQWHTPSWNNVMPGRPIEMLQQHLKVYR
jgi:hypothetical protein